MGYSSLYEALRKESDEELIEDWDLGTSGRPGRKLLETTDQYTAGVFLPTRDIIKERGLEEKVKEYDIRLIKHVLKYGADPVWERDSGEINPPLENWWWWLDKIANKEYPSKLLPDYLKEIYLSN
ncbi:hypothetical protein [Sulfurihydrogenibium sp.]|jgi:hypothetical protein|uniref:hypothetical protein n=1 Tax=Sulfurihydrogenibium sp. TaxID=2053621 RepID=UPI00263A35FB|nr:hypothetical protein [Sulfurihydrogenibium sp.]